MVFHSREKISARDFSMFALSFPMGVFSDLCDELTVSFSLVAVPVTEQDKNP